MVDQPGDITMMTSQTFITDSYTEPSYNVTVTLNPSGDHLDLLLEDQRRVTYLYFVVSPNVLYATVEYYAYQDSPAPEVRTQKPQKFLQTL